MRKSKKKAKKAPAKKTKPKKTKALASPRARRLKRELEEAQTGPGISDVLEKLSNLSYAVSEIVQKLNERDPDVQKEAALMGAAVAEGFAARVSERMAAEGGEDTAEGIAFKLEESEEPMTVTIKVETEDDMARLRRMLSADKAYRALHDIRNEIFRPARKHGYSDPKLNDVLEVANRHEVSTGDKDAETGEALTVGSGHELIHLLEQKLNEILEENGVNMDDYN